METLDVVGEEVGLFPLIERFVEGALQFRQIGGRRVFGETMERENRAQRGKIRGETGIVPVRAREIAEIRFPEILDPEETKILPTGQNRGSGDTVPDEEVGDGTTSVIILAGEFLSAVEGFIEKEIHPTVLVGAYFKALEEIVRITESVGVSI